MDARLRRQMPGASYSPFLPLVAYTESLCVGARVLFVGNARSEVPLRLVERGARVVHVCDDHAARRAEAAQRTTDRAVSFGALNDGSFALREGFFDLALVENLAAHSDPKQVLASIARLLAPRGAALIATPNPETRTALIASEVPGAIDYYALYDGVAAEFPRVRMLGQVPFVGYAVVDFASEGEPAVVFDASLVSSHAEEPDYFVAVAGEEIAALDAYAVIQLPSRAVVRETAGQKPAPVAATPEARPAEAREAEARKAAEAREVEARKAEARATEAREVERRRLEAWIAELEARAAAADERADAADAELDELRERHANLEQARRHELEALVSERDQLKVEVERQNRQKHDLGELLQSTRVELTSAQAESQALREKLAALTADGANAEDLRRLEAQLTERGEHVRKLERDLRQAERTGRELLRRLERAERLGPEPVRESAAGAPIAPEAPPPDASSLRLAELEAERVVLTWALEIAKGERAPAPGQFGG